MDLRLGISDIFYLLVTFLLLGIIIYFKRARNIGSKPYYRFYFPAFAYKVAGGFFFAAIYVYLYGGGDTTAYYDGGIVLANLFYDDPAAYFSEVFGRHEYLNYFKYYDADTGYPPSWLYRSARHFFVCKIASIPCIFMIRNFWVITMLFSYFSFLGLWRLYEVFRHQFPQVEKMLVVPVLFVPSVACWTSGIMKDTIVMIALCFMIWNLHCYLSVRPRRVSLAGMIIRSVFFGWLMLQTKPYVLLALLPGIGLWINYLAIQRIKSRIIKFVMLPLLLIAITVGGLSFYLNSDAVLAEFSADQLINTATVMQQDFATNETYGENRIDIGKFEPTVPGILAKVPVATNVGLFRPYLWEANSLVMLLAGFENFVLLLLTIYMLWKKRIIGVIPFIRSRPLIVLSFVFFMILAFSIGLTSGIFGALVRFKAPLLPFFTSFLFLAVYERKWNIKEAPAADQASNDL